MNKGILYSAGAYFLWGFFPIYLRAMQAVPAVQITAHRIAWSFIFLLALVLVRRESEMLRASLTRGRLLVYLGAALLLAVNWLTYVWAVNAGLVVEASLGYFLNPLVSVVLGVVILKEKVRAWQWVPVGLAAAGVIWLTASLGKLPWIALVLATTFGLYGLIKKIAPLGSLFGLTTETALIFLPALGFLLVQEFSGAGSFGHTDGVTTLLLVLTGVVTAVPLLLFSAGARLVPLFTMGLLQYISPSMQFITGLLIFGESFSLARGIGFGMIWLALLIFTVEAYLNRRKVALAA